MILTGPEIKKQIQLGKTCTQDGMPHIHVDPYDPSLVGPNSIDLRLGDKLLVYAQNVCNRHIRTPFIWDQYYIDDSDPISLHEPESPSILDMRILDMRIENATREIVIPEAGLVLRPGILYLGTTIECIGSNLFVPIVEGRSSVGRLGIHVHVTAGFCDVGFKGQITLEIHVIHPVRVYAGTPICQAYFLTPHGEIELYKGRYQDQKGPIASRLHIPKSEP